MLFLLVEKYYSSSIQEIKTILPYAVKGIVYHSVIILDTDGKQVDHPVNPAI